MTDQTEASRTSLSPAKRVARLDSLTGLRIFAALLVFGYHIVGGLAGDTFNPFGAGMTGVSFFYIVSGFVLAWTARDGDTKPAFYLRRFARVYPLYLFCWVTALILILLAGRALTWQDVFAVTLLQSWYPDRDLYFGASPVFWSLSCEAFFYLAFPFVFPLVARLSDVGRRTLMLACAVGVIALSAASSPIEPGSVEAWFIYVFPPVRFVEFLLGMLLALEFRRSRARTFPLSWAIVLVVAAQALATVAPDSLKRTAITLIPFMLLVWAAAHADLRGNRSVLRSATIVRLGVWSYAVYLIHPQVMTVVGRIQGKFLESPQSLTDGWFMLHFTLSLVGTVVAAGVLHHVVEAPMERRLRPKVAGPRLDA